MTSAFTENEAIPSVFKRRYGMSAEAENKIVAKGKITVSISWVIVLLRIILRLFKVMPPYNGKEIPITVTYSYDKTLNAINVDRMFYYPHRNPINIKSQQSFILDNIMLEISPYHLGTTFFWHVIDNQLYFTYRSYILKIKNWLIRLPIGLILGKCDAKETALSETKFSMELRFNHPWFGTTYEYFGTFELVDTRNE